MNKPVDPDLQREAEDLHAAITRGEIDAFVIGRDDNRRVLLLANAYQRYRQLVERMQQGAVTVSLEGRVLYANQRFAEMLGVPLSQLYTAPLDSYVAVGDRARLASFLIVGGRESQLELGLRRRDGTTIPVSLAHASVSDGYTTLLITALRPAQWPGLTVEALESIRASVRRLDGLPGLDAQARESLASIGEQIEGLARMIEEMRDVQNPPPER